MENIQSSSPIFQHITILREGHITWVTLNRPDKANALSHDHLAEIETAALAFREDSETRVVIFNGNGRHFSSGADLSEPKQTPPLPLVKARRRGRMGERAIEAILNIDQITIAAWHGAAMGGGACVTTACDFRVGAQGCFMQYPEIDLGINLMWKSLPLILNLVGPARAKRLVVGAERLYAEELLDWGILDELVAATELKGAAKKMADFYASKPPVAAQMIKQSTNQLANALNHAIMHMDTDQNLLSARTEDRQTAIDAYFNKQPGDYQGN
ncbi:MAG: enoyl-CoA hydratase [Candidatus Azotimanducaceae bacterium]|mgnify:FL=1|jgi:enoyl-CoA hydratase|tara:strand:- start:5181 stop:5993 length:813 start_codon:yes stop_codon:yes gene_type:complete